VSKVRHSAGAENDLLEAWLFIAEDSVEAADRLTVASVLPGRIPLGVPGLTLASYR